MIGTVSEIASAVSGSFVGDGRVEVSGVSFDSRRTSPGDLFFALVAQRDGHEFVPDAVRAGAAAVVASEVLDASVPVIRVPDTLVALQDLGTHQRRRMPATVVGLTGSCGKTTVRELIAQALSSAGPVLKSAGNLNNHIGVPLTLTALTRNHAFCVVEMGANHHGEIASLTRIADPDVGLVTCVAEAHTEFFGGLEGVARAKGELFAGMRPDAVAVVNLDDRLVRAMQRASGREVTYGTDPAADVVLQRCEPEVQGGQQVTLGIGDASLVVHLSLDGDHNALNAAGAVAVSVACGLDPAAAAAGLSSVAPVEGRGALRPGRRVDVLDDTYNANPASMRAGMRTLRSRARGRRTVAVLGEMFELGEQSSMLHEGLGREAASLGIHHVVAVGPHASAVREGTRAGDGGVQDVTCFETTDAALAGIGDVLHEGDLVLVKGSRAMKMERLVDFLLYW